MTGQISAGTAVTLDAAHARVIVEESIRSYFRKRRSRVPGFVDATFSFTGALGTHHHAFGHDLWRAPLNAIMTGPQFGLDAAAFILARTGRNDTARWLRSRELFFRTSVSDAIARRIVVDLLELPYDGPGTPSFQDALATEIVGHPQLAGAIGALSGGWGEDERARMERRMAEHLAIYLNSRAAAGEVAGAAIAASAGGLLLNQFTPGFLTLGPALARALAVKIGGTAGALGAGAAVLATTSVASAFAGLATDPLQRALGIHHARLIRLLDALEDAFLGGDARLAVPERYVARLIDLVDVMASLAARLRVGG